MTGSGAGPVACLLMLVGAGLHFAPDTVNARIRATVSDALRPGQSAARQVSILARENLSQLATKAEAARQRELNQLQEQLQEEQERTAALQLQLARLSELQNREDALPERMRSLPPLVSTSLVSADVLGDSIAEKWKKGKLLNRGEASGIRESELVVKSRHSLVDVGRDGKLSAEDALLLGRCVIGKIERVGRWTSTFLLLTDSGYRGRAQLVHQTDTGFVFVGKGILEGQGSPLCRLKGISSSEAVTVGDTVYTSARDGQPSTPLYYGRVVEATLDPAESEWMVLVEPVPVPSDLTSVQVLRTSVNAGRLTEGQ